MAKKKTAGTREGSWANRKRNGFGFQGSEGIHLFVAGEFSSNHQKDGLA